MHISWEYSSNPLTRRFWMLSVLNEIQSSSLQWRVPCCCGHFIHWSIYATGISGRKGYCIESLDVGQSHRVLEQTRLPWQRIILHLKSISLQACVSNCFYLSNWFCLSTWPWHTMRLWNQNFPPWTKLFLIQLVLRLSRCYSNWIFNGSDTFRSRLKQIQKVQIN